MTHEIFAYFKEKGRKGGLTTSKRHGKEHYKMLGQLGAEAKRRKKAEREAQALVDKSSEKGLDNN